MIHNIANATQLTAALSAAQAGDTLRLAGGNYGTFTIRDRVYAGNVRIESADPTNAAHFDGLTVRGSSNITLAGLDLGRALTGTEQSFTTLNTIRDSNNITLTGVTVHGSLDDNPQNDGRGLVVENVRGLLVEDSFFTELNRGIVIEQSFNVVLRHSEWKTIRSDGINMFAVEGAVVFDNDFSDFRPISPDHGDVIQISNTGQTRGSKNITIENNRAIITNEGGAGTQGFFISDPLEHGYDNILIRNNVLYSNGAYHGINVDGARQLQITGNTVVSKRGDEKDFWIRTGTSEGVILDGNVTDNIILANVTKLFQGENHNLKLFPNLANALPNLLNPTSPSDLLVSGIGFSPLAWADAAPVSDALASALSGSISPSQSQQAFAPVPVNEPAGNNPLGLSLAQMLTATPTLEPLTVQSVDLAAGTHMVAPLWAEGFNLQHFNIA